MKYTSIVCGAAATAAMIAAGAASATTFTTYDITWSGAPFGNGASATGYITVDDTLPSLGGSNQIDFPTADVTGLSITITGADAGNGTFGLSDFASFIFWSPTALNLTEQLICQPVSGGKDFYGDPDGGGGGDFNLFGATSTAPYGHYYFQLGTDEDTGDLLQVTSITAAVPEPGAWTMMIAGFAALGAALRRRTASTVRA